jgi:hypothetical protein
VGQRLEPLDVFAEWGQHVRVASSSRRTRRRSAAPVEPVSFESPVPGRGRFPGVGEDSPVVDDACYVVPHVEDTAAGRSIDYVSEVVTFTLRRYCSQR